ncbi:hypothetical protein SDC9_143333 [bioreactor metagenome]|uniref:S1 motif domain-containing protein n=1 Tax=bioreactor metagenome TaxID=1076179 RepID=A0A645E3T2_9ZZZZ
MFTVDSIHEGVIVEMMDKGAVISLPYGVEGFATPKHLVKEDGSQAQVDEKLSFKVIEFNKDAKRIILSHSRIHEDAKRTEKAAAGETTGEAPKKAVRKAKKEETTSSQSVEKTTLGDIQSLADLKDQLVNAAAEKMVKAEKAKKAAKAQEENVEGTEEAPKKSTKKAKTEEAAEEAAEA